jgi:molybdate transport system permease protein
MVSISLKRIAAQKEEVHTKHAPKEMDHFWRLAAVPLLLFISLPFIGLFLKITPASFLQNLNKIQVIQAINISFSSALITTLIAIIFGMPVAYLIAKQKNAFFRLVDTMMDLPTVLPPAVAGIALLMTFGRNGLVGIWLADAGISITFTQVAVILAQTFVAVPLFVKSATIGFAAIDPEIRQAAALDGASRWQTFTHVILPLSWASIVSGAMLTWARALGEFGATLIFAGNLPGRTQTMPLAIYLGFESNLQSALSMAVILIAISFLTLMLVKIVLYRFLNPNYQ